MSDHEHDLKLEKVLINTHICVKCLGTLCANEIEILNQLYEVGAFCDNEKCDRYLLLVL